MKDQDYWDARQGRTPANPASPSALQGYADAKTAGLLSVSTSTPPLIASFILPPRAAPSGGGGLYGPGKRDKAMDRVEEEMRAHIRRGEMARAGIAPDSESGRGGLAGVIGLVIATGVGAYAFFSWSSAPTNTSSPAQYEDTQKPSKSDPPSAAELERRADLAKQEKERKDALARQEEKKQAGIAAEKARLDLIERAGRSLTQPFMSRLYERGETYISGPLLAQALCTNRCNAESQDKPKIDYNDTDSFPLARNDRFSPLVLMGALRYPVNANFYLRFGLMWHVGQDGAVQEKIQIDVHGPRPNRAWENAVSAVLAVPQVSAETLSAVCEQNGQKETRTNEVIRCYQGGSYIEVWQSWKLDDITVNFNTGEVSNKGAVVSVPVQEPPKPSPKTLLPSEPTREPSAKEIAQQKYTAQVQALYKEFTQSFDARQNKLGTLVFEDPMRMQGLCQPTCLTKVDGLRQGENQADTSVLGDRSYADQLNNKPRAVDTWILSNTRHFAIPFTDGSQVTIAMEVAWRMDNSGAVREQIILHVDGPPVQGAWETALKGVFAKVGIKEISCTGKQPKHEPDTVFGCYNGGRQVKLYMQRPKFTLTFPTPP